MNNKPLTAIWIFVIIGMVAIFFLSWQERKQFRTELSKTDAEFITNELHRRAAGDCVLTQTAGGWRCTEMTSGKVFIVRR